VAGTVPRALILDFDGSVHALPGAASIGLGEWQEAIRFGCSRSTLDALEAAVLEPLRGTPAPVFTGSGDFHHVTYLLVRRLGQLDTPVQVVVFDNHPDNMRYPFGIHCGSWVRHVSRLPFVKRVHVLGIHSRDVEGARLWENYLGPLYSGKVAYWCVQRDLAWLRRLGVGGCRTFSSIGDLLADFAETMTTWRDPIYLSIDKDVLAPHVAQTNWDQGLMRWDELTRAILMLKGRLVGSDVTGDISAYRYRAPFKRILAGMDRQPVISPPDLERWQAQHFALNVQLLELLAAP